MAVSIEEIKSRLTVEQAAAVAAWSRFGTVKRRWVVFAGGCIVGFLAHWLGAHW